MNTAATAATIRVGALAAARAATMTIAASARPRELRRQALASARLVSLIRFVSRGTNVMCRAYIMRRRKLDARLMCDRSVEEKTGRNSEIAVAEDVIATGRAKVDRFGLKSPVRAKQSSRIRTCHQHGKARGHQWCGKRGSGCVAISPV